MKERMITSATIARAARMPAAHWTPGKKESSKVGVFVDRFFRQLDSYTNDRACVDGFPGASGLHDLISEVASQAEMRLGYRPGKMGWLAWFSQVLRGEKRLLQNLCAHAKRWPPLEREIFELYYVKGMALADIALLTGCTPKAFHTHLVFIQRRLRMEMIRQVLAESRSATAARAQVHARKFSTKRFF